MASLNDLPNELLFKIKDCIHDSDLRTHVCFYKSCDRAVALYGTEDDEESFWEQAYWLAGIGLKGSETPHERDRRYDTWRKIAFDCIERDGFCEHPYCGLSLLYTNASYMKDCIQEGRIPYKKPLEVRMFNAEPEKTWLEAHSLLRTVVFSQGQDISSLPSPPEVGRDARLALSPEDPTSSRTLLENHPLATRSFATFPPTRKIYFIPLVGLKIAPVERSTGLTVEDVVAMVHAKLDTPVVHADVAHYRAGAVKYLNFVKETELPYYDEDTRAQFNAVMNTQTSPTLRSILAIDSWDGLGWKNMRRVGALYCISLESGRWR